MSKNNNQGFSLSASQARAVVLLLAICLIIVGVNWWQSHTPQTPPKITSNEEIEEYEKSPILKVNINFADSAMLTRLKGIGPVTAKKIIEYRNLNGYFKSIHELDSVKGIGEKTITALDSFITADTLNAQ